MGRRADRRRIVRVRGQRVQERPDTLAVEEPLEIRVNGQPVSVTMRTPGDDFELAAGFLLAEGLIGADDIAGIEHCTRGSGGMVDGLVNVRLRPGVEVQPRRRSAPITSACGVCGVDSIDQVRTVARWPLAGDPLSVPVATLASLPDRLREAQDVFTATGGLHAAGLFDATGRLICAREDVGRHNAVDKVIGESLLAGRMPLGGHILQVSGRASFELVQKAAMAGIACLAAVSAPSTLAVDLAEEIGLTLIGFMRGDALNVYSRPERITALGAGLAEAAPRRGPSLSR